MYLYMWDSLYNIFKKIMMFSVLRLSWPWKVFNLLLSILGKMMRISRFDNYLFLTDIFLYREVSTRAGRRSWWTIENERNNQKEFHCSEKKEHTECPNKLRNSVTNWISSLLWISIVISNFKSHNISMSARVYFMKIMSPQDEQWKRTSLMCLYTVIFLFY